jgi:hypothetical protein
MGALTKVVNPHAEVVFKHDEMGLEIERLLPGNLRKQKERDRLGRITGQNILSNYTKSRIFGA